MKTAIIFTGFVRSFSFYGKKLYENLFKAFPNADLYFCTWNTIDLDNKTKINPNIFYELENCKGVKILEWDNFKDKISKTIKQNRENDIFNINKFAIEQGIESSNKIRNQWFLVNQTKDLISNNQQYDVIVRTRFDLNYIYFETDKIKKGITIPYNFFSNHYAENMDISSGYCDHLAYGDPESMFKYLNMYEHIDNMYDKNINIAHAEGLLKYYLREYLGNDVHLNNKILYQIVKNENNIDNTPLEQYKYHENNIT